MVTENDWGTFGFRYSESPHLALCSLFAVGHEHVSNREYSWDGLTRTDGPLLLFQYTMSGEGIFETEQDTYKVGEGTAFLTEIPGNHRYYFPENGTDWEFYFVLIRPRLILPNWEEAKTKLGVTPQLPYSSKPIRLLREMYAEAKAGRISDPYSASSFVYQFVSELCRFSSSSRSNRDSWPDKIKQAVSIMETQYANMLSLDQMAEALQLSKYHLLRTFSAAVGMTPNDYLNQIRMNQSMELLRSTNWNMEQIAAHVGYSSGSYFIKVFHKLTGQTPGAFRSGGGNHLVFNRLFFD